MELSICAKNLTVVLLQDYQNLENLALALVLDADYKQFWFGDAYQGPGSVEMNINAVIKRMFVIETRAVYREQKSKKQKEEKWAFNSVIQNIQQNSFEFQSKENQSKSIRKTGFVEENQLYKDFHPQMVDIIKLLKVQMQKIYWVPVCKS